LDKHEYVNDSSNHSKTDYFQSGSGKFCNYYVNIHSVYSAILHDYKQSPMSHIYYLWKKNEQKKFSALDKGIIFGKNTIRMCKNIHCLFTFSTRAIIWSAAMLVDSINRHMRIKFCGRFSKEKAEAQTLA